MGNLNAPKSGQVNYSSNNTVLVFILIKTHKKNKKSYHRLLSHGRWHWSCFPCGGLVLILEASIRKLAGRGFSLFVKSRILQLTCTAPYHPPLFLLLCLEKMSFILVEAVVCYEAVKLRRREYQHITFSFFLKIIFPLLGNLLSHSQMIIVGLTTFQKTVCMIHRQKTERKYLNAI